MKTNYLKQLLSASTLLFLLFMASACDNVIGISEEMTVTESQVSSINFQTPSTVNGLVGGSTTASCGSEEFTIFAGQHNKVGTAVVSNDETNLYVTYTTDGEWFFTELHLYVMDTEPTSRLIPGRAPHKSGDVSYTQSYTFTIPLDDNIVLGESELWIQGHAAVVKIVGGEVVQGETAYAGEITHPQRRGGAWYGNMKYRVIDCEVTCQATESAVQTETAWAGETSGGGNAWWYIFDVEGVATQNIYAGRTIVVGNVTYDDGKLFIELIDGWELKDDDESVKIQGYDSGNLPDSRPAAGLFDTYKGDKLTVEVRKFDYYAIHLDVQLKKESDCVSK